MRFPEKSELSQRARPLRFSPEQPSKPWAPEVVTDREARRFPWGLAFAVAVIMAVGIAAWLVRQ